MTTADALPEDLPGLRAVALALLAERDELLRRIERMRHIIRQLQRAQFGRHSERLDPDRRQLALEERDIASVPRRAAEKRARARRPRAEPGQRQSLPLHLPRVEIVIEPERTSCPCCGGAMHVIGEERSTRLDVIPAQHRVLVTRRPKYGCRACAGAVVQAPAPERLIRSGLPTEALVAHALVSKYAWHLPLYRQAQILLAQGIEIERSVLAFWVGYAAAELMPLWRRLREIRLGAPRLFVDETRAPVLDPGRGRTKAGYFWSMARDDRTWRGDTDPPAVVVYTYAPGRGAEHAITLLAGYRGIVQCDGYAAYKQVAHRDRAGNAVILAFCWAHWRRRFYEIAKGGSAPIAEEARRRIAELYDIEARIRGRSAAERGEVRQADSKPLVAELKAWIQAQLARASAKSAIATAIRYGLNHWEGLERFLEDGRIEIDTNVVERSMRPLARDRKNWLFAGHDAGAENWACLASLIETCKLNGVDPQAYLTDVLTRLVNLWPAVRIDELMPWAWGGADSGGRPAA